MESQRDQDERERQRNHGLMVLFVGFIAPSAVLMLSGIAECYTRAFYAVCLGALMLGGGFWVVFRAKPDELAKRWTPVALKPAWAIVVRICGVFVIAAALGFVLPRTLQDMVELFSSRRPTTFVEVARGVEGRSIIHPVFQTVRLRGGASYRQVYMFAYGGKRLIDGRRYVISVLPRSHWVLSAHEVTDTASQ